MTYESINHFFFLLNQPIFKIEDLQVNCTRSVATPHLPLSISEWEITIISYSVASLLQFTSFALPLID